MRTRIKKDSDTIGQLELLVQEFEQTKFDNNKEEKQYQKEVEILRRSAEVQARNLKSEINDLKK